MKKTGRGKPRMHEGKLAKTIGFSGFDHHENMLRGLSGDYSGASKSALLRAMIELTYSDGDVRKKLEKMGLEPTTSALRTQRSPS